MHLFLINQGPLKLLMAFFISIHYVPDLNLTVICSSVTFHHPWHAVFDTSRQCLSMHVRRAFQKTPVRCSSVILTAVWHTALRSPLAKSLHRHSASHSLMSQHISHPVWAVFNVAGLPHTHTQSAVWLVRANRSLTGLFIAAFQNWPWQCQSCSSLCCN